MTTVSRADARSLAVPALALAGVVAGCAVVLWADPTTEGGPLPTCPSKLLLGIVCPGCGSLRMIYSLLHGDLVAAVHYNVVGLVAIPLLGWSAVAWTGRRYRGTRLRDWTHWRWAPLATCVVLAVWLVIRNLPFAPFTALRV